jgi:hypothetical protein
MKSWIILAIFSVFGFRLCADPNGNAVLVYHLKPASKIGETVFVPPSLHPIDEETGTTTTQTAKFQYYHIILYNPASDLFEKEYVIKFEKDKKAGRIYQRNALGVSYSTYFKLPKTATPTLRYLIGTTFQASGRDVNPGNVCGKMIRANIPLSERIDVGAAEKYYLPKEMSGRMVQQVSGGWQLLALYGRLNTTYTKHINQSGLTLEEAFQYLSEILSTQGYGGPIKPQSIDTSQPVSYDNF